MPKEIWKPIAGYEGLYEVSSSGRVRSLGRYVNHGKHQYWRCGRIRKPYNTDGYISVSLNKDSKCITYQVHRLVAEAFIPNPDHKEQVNHIDGCKTNNNVENLEWVTRSENVIHAIHSGLIQHQDLVDRSRIGADIISKRLLCVDTDEVFSSISEAVRKIGCSSLAESYSSGKRSHSGRGWLFKEISEEYYQQHKDDVLDSQKCKSIHDSIHCRVGNQGRACPVKCIELDTVYESVVKAAKANNMNNTTIHLAIKENRKAKGLTFVYLGA